VSRIDEQPSASRKLEAAVAFPLARLVDYAAGSIVSRILEKGPAGMLTMMAFDAGEEVSEHTTPCDAYAMIIDGSAEMTIGETRVSAVAGDVVLLPADVPHSLRAVQRFKMLLAMLRK
jgi:quercetin dioxygenase-like cupin family protein